MNRSPNWAAPGLRPADAAFSPDGQVVGLSLGGFPVSLWEIPEGTQLWSGGDFSLALSPDGRYLAHSDTDAAGNALVVLRSADGAEVVQTLGGHIGVVWRLLFSPDSSRLLSAGEAMRIWEVPDGRLLNVLSADCP
jgi:WD40 repeat protein